MSYGILPSDDELFVAAEQHELKNRQRSLFLWQTGFPLIQDGHPVAWIKYGRERIRLEDEAATQRYIYEAILQQPDLSKFVRVPEIYRVIRDNTQPYVLIVMEYVHGQTVRQWLEISKEKQNILWGRILHAMKVLLSLYPPVRTTPPGPVGGGRIIHFVFGEYCETGDAPREFDSVKDLQNHVNQIIDGRNGFANFLSEDFRLCHCDPHQSNFMIADGEGSGPLYVIDFRHCMWLPVSFLRWALVINPRDPIFPYLGRNLEKLQPPFCLEIHHRILNEFNDKQGCWDTESIPPP